MIVHRAAVTGATGRIGTPLVRALIDAGVAVRALSRQPQPPVAGVQWVVGDLHDAAALATLTDDVEVVFHAGGQLDGTADAVYRSLVGGTECVVRAAAHARLVHLSSLVVLDTASPRDIIDSDTPLEPAPARRGSYTQAKVAAEAVVREAMAIQDVVIVRPGLVIVPGRNPMPPSVALRAGPFWVPIGPLAAELPVVAATTVAAGLLDAARSAPSGAVVHLLDGDPTTRGALLQRLRRDLTGGVVLPTGSIVLALAVAGMHRSDAAYRIVSAARPHRWTVGSR